MTAKKEPGKQPSRRNKQTELRDLTKLKPHPRQAEDFGDLPAHEFDALVNRIKRCGLDEKIQIMPDGTIISGHQRCRALLKLGHRKYEVLVRYDLVGASDEEIEREFLEANTIRRQLSPLDQIKHALRIVEIERKKPRGSLVASGNPQVRDKVASMLEMSPKNASRYISILRCPPPIQAAFESKFLTLIEASRCAFLSKECRTTLANGLSSVRSRAEAKQLLGSVQAKEPKANRHPTTEFERLGKALVRACALVEPQVKRVNPATIHVYRKVLRRARSLIQELIARIPEDE